MAPVKNNSSRKKKSKRNKLPSGKNSPDTKASNQKMKCAKNSDNCANVGKKTAEHSRSSQNSEDMFLHESSSGSSSHLSPSKIFDCSSSGRKLSVRKMSFEVSSSLPLENDSEEEEEETEETKKTEQENSIPTTLSVEGVSSEPLISNTVKSMSLDQMKEHITCCLRMNTENKINTKNAFALKLIDCMTLMVKNQDENNLVAMACQLDAGTKIYSNRVDAVHQQVMKLAESCAYAERKGTKTKEEDQSGDELEQNDNLDENRKRRKAKKKILATREQITRKLKGKDPRGNFVQLEAKPGSIFNSARRDPRDLSLTLEKHIPFWRDFSKPGLRVGGTVPFPCYDEIVKLRAEYKKDGKLNPEEPLSAKYKIPQNPEVDYENPRPSTSVEDDHGHFEDAVEELCGDEPESKLPEEVVENVANAPEKKELQIITLAEAKLSMEMARKPSRFEVLKYLFYMDGENEYDYLKMHNITTIMTGATHWKRPQRQSVNAAANKKKSHRKKKKPLEINYKKDAAEVDRLMSLNVNLSKRPNLSRRTLASWKKKKFAYPHDIHFDPLTLYKLFNIDAKALFKDRENQEICTKDEESNLLNLDIGVERNYFSEDNASTCSDGTCSDTVTSQAVSDEPFTDNFECDESSQESSNTAESDHDLVQDGIKEKAACALSRPSTSNGVYEGDNLVPMVKIVQVEPIRCVPKPNRVDFQHLKDVMLQVIKEKMLDKKNDSPPTEAGETPTKSIVAFKDVLYELFNSNRLHHRTQEDLSVAMAFLCLLTLTNENTFSLTQEGNTGTEDVLISYATDEHLNRQSSH